MAICSFFCAFLPTLDIDVAMQADRMVVRMEIKSALVIILFISSIVRPSLYERVIGKLNHGGAYGKNGVIYF
jgi:hypothetical protein